MLSIRSGLMTIPSRGLPASFRCPLIYLSRQSSIPALHLRKMSQFRPRFGSMKYEVKPQVVFQQSSGSSPNQSRQKLSSSIFVSSLSSTCLVSGSLLTSFSNNRVYFSTEKPDSKVEKTSPTVLVPSNQDKKEVQIDPKTGLPVKPKRSIKTIIIDGIKHTWHGFKLLAYEIRTCVSILRRVLNGHTLTRRERAQLSRTFADLLRVIPFMFFVIVPFAELLLPVCLWIWPNMLPSTFEDSMKKVKQFNLI